MVKLKELKQNKIKQNARKKRQQKQILPYQLRCDAINKGTANGVHTISCQAISRLHKETGLVQQQQFTTNQIPIIKWIISMAWCKTAVTPLLTHWSYCRLALSHWCILTHCSDWMFATLCCVACITHSILSAVRWRDMYIIVLSLVVCNAVRVSYISLCIHVCLTHFVFNSIICNVLYILCLVPLDA